MREVSTSLSNDKYLKLEKICKITNSESSEFFKEALESYIEESEDYLDAMKSLKANGRRYTLEELRGNIDGMEN